MMFYLRTEVCSKFHSVFMKEHGIFCITCSTSSILNSFHFRERNMLLQFVSYDDFSMKILSNKVFIS